MRHKQLFRMLVLVIILAMSSSWIAACTRPATSEATTSPATVVTTTSAPPVQAKPLVVGYSAFSEKFSPFFSESAYDAEVAAMTSLSLLTTDRTGGIVYKAIAGETIPYNGKDYTYNGIADVDVQYDKASNRTVYTWTIRNDVRFSDGKLMTADDIIFSYYVYLDPAYNGASTVYSVAIEGLNDYRTQTTSAVYDKYNQLYDDMLKAGSKHKRAAGDAWTEEQQFYLWKVMQSNWTADVQAIVDYVMAKYLGEAEGTIGFKDTEVTATPGLQIALGMALWGFGSVKDGVLAAPSGKTWNLANKEYPTIDDYYQETYLKYKGDPDAYWRVETSDSEGTSIVEKTRAAFIAEWGPQDTTMGGQGIPNITGIKKQSDTVVQVTVKGYDATAIYSLGITVTPLHYYGDPAQYNYAANQFGFKRTDLSTVQARTTRPMGAGPYKFIKYENKTVYFEANEFYYNGQPEIQYMQFKETLDSDKVSAVGTGTVDITDPSFSSDAVTEIGSYNSNGQISGDKLVTSTVDNLGYGYIGINADTVKVGSDPGSAASKNLRKGLATVLAVYRDLAVDSYYGERATVINYPISSTSWAAPQKTDEGYKPAYSTGTDGKPVYTSAMTADDKYAAALQTAVSCFKAAGYTFDQASGKLTGAPKGAKLEYEVIVPADGKGDHPSFMLLSKARDAFATIGLNLVINDPSDSNVLWDKLSAGTQELWCAAWNATIDPDMYQIYFSGNIVGKPGATGSNHYHIQDANLDRLMMEARTSDDQTFRKATYKACLDIILDWAVEIPIYQRQNCILFSAERVKMATVTPDITTFWAWYNDLELLEMN